MARRTTKRKTRRRRGTNLLSMLEAVTYGSIMTEGLFGTNIVNFVLGSMNPETGKYSHSGIVYGKGISIRELISDPASAGMVAQNLQDNALDMAMKSFVAGASFKIGKKLLARPIRSVNANLLKPVLGSSVRL